MYASIRSRSTSSFCTIFMFFCYSLTVPPIICLAADPIASFSMEVDLGKDLGQNFGSLFEVRNSKNEVVAGAGFMEVYNTRFRSDRHTLQFFFRPAEDANRFAIERLPHPDLDCGVYLLDLDQRLYAWSSVKNNSVRRWNADKREWSTAQIPKTGQVRSGDGIMRLGTGTLTFTGNTVTYNDRQILGPPDIGRYYNFYYAHGRLFFFHTHKMDPDGFTRIYACPWTADSPDPIDLQKATILQTKYVGATPFAWGQFRGEIITVSNYGGVYVFDGTAWRTLLEARKGVSYQVYSMLNYHDRLLLSQYPTGELFEYRGKEIKQLKGWPPKLDGVSPRAREAQTMAVYRGDLFVGVWPWAEVWRYNHDDGSWHSLGRMFTHPETTDKSTHPYEAEANKHGLVTNHWGQRVTGMVPNGKSLMLSTSSKGTYEWFDRYEFLTDGQRREYGAVIKLTMPGNLASQIKWKNRPIRLEFVIEKTRLTIRQDGELLAETDLPSVEADRLQLSMVKWGQGVFGKLNGRLISKSHSF